MVMVVVVVVVVVEVEVEVEERVVLEEVEWDGRLQVRLYSVFTTMSYPIP